MLKYNKLLFLAICSNVYFNFIMEGGVCCSLYTLRYVISVIKNNSTLAKSSNFKLNINSSSGEE